MNRDPRRIARTLGYEFRDWSLIDQALTHRSASAANNERLEFLGDALIGFLIADALLRRFPAADEGTLSRMRATLVKGESLAALARRIELGEYLRLGPGEVRTGGHARDSILADAFEAVLGAIYLDGGFEAAGRAVGALFEDTLERTSLERVAKDPKTRLQEWLHAHKRPAPEYHVVAIGGTQHAQTFLVSCELIDGDQRTHGEGTSRRRAEQAAASAMLEQFADD